MQNTRFLVLGVLLLAGSGCQCCGLTEHYQDSIDHIADRTPNMDRFYHPGLDLTRIGYPDWCQSPINRCIYGDCCCRDTRQQPGYVHNPMYVPHASSRSMPIPESPQIAPKNDIGPDSKNEEKVPTRVKGIPDPKELDQGNQLPPLPPLDAPIDSPTK